MTSRRSLWGRAVGAVLTMSLLAACGSGSSGAAAPSAGADGSSSGAATSASAGPSGVTVPGQALVKDGELAFCSDMTAPPLEFLDPAQKPVGAEIELGDALARTMGLRPVWKQVSFNGIIPALQAKQCDVILSQLFIKPEREKVVDFVPYLNSSNTVVVKSGGAVDGIDALCGKKAAAQTGTTAADYFKTASEKCTGGAKIDIRLFTKDTDALQQLKLGLVDAYGTTLETAAFIIKQQPGQFAMAGEPFGAITCGMATRKDARPVHDALTAALQTVRADGTYDKILAEWNLTGDALKS